jgi:hypothetical protein
MKHLRVTLLLLATAACSPVGRISTSGILPREATASGPVYLPVLCTLMGRGVRSEAPAGAPVILMWGWSAATQAQVEDYIRAAIVAVTFDGDEIQGVQSGGIPYDEAAQLFKAVWLADIGAIPAGLHKITYSLAFREKIFDGSLFYGPGTDMEKQEDRCEIMVH